jgi:prepilin-type N-terminal cleavage/methylation domain-containing protein
MKVVIKKKIQEVVDRNEKGFTTIELIIVIVIAGIMAAVAIPKMGNVSTVDLYTTARQVKSDIRYAQQLAMSKYTNTTITFNGNADTYAITGNGISTTPKFLPPSSKSKFSATYTFTFNSSGVPNTGGTIVILSGADSEQVVVSSVTGRATIP